MAYADAGGTGEAEDIFVSDLARGVRLRITTDPGSERNPVWAPDGNSLVFSSLRRGCTLPYWKSLLSQQPEQLLYADSESLVPESWSSDGRFLLLGDEKAETKEWLLSLEGTPPKAGKLLPFGQDAPALHGCNFSPDSKWAVCSSDRSGNSEVYVANVPGATRRLQVSIGSGQSPRWRGDGKEIFYVSTDLKLIAVPVIARGDRLEFGQPKALFDLPGTGGTRLAYDVTADGQRFLFQTSDEEPGAAPIRLVQNWPAAKLKQ